MGEVREAVRLRSTLRKRPWDRGHARLLATSRLRRMELLLHRLPGLAPVLVILRRSGLHPLKVFLRLLQPLDKHLLFRRQVGWVLLQQLRHLLRPCWLNRLLLP